MPAELALLLRQSIKWSVQCQHYKYSLNDLAQPFSNTQPGIQHGMSKDEIENLNL